MSALSLACTFSARYFVWRAWSKSQPAGRAHALEELGSGDQCTVMLGNTLEGIRQESSSCPEFEAALARSDTDAERLRWERNVCFRVSLSSGSWHWRTYYQDKVKASIMVSRTPLTLKIPQILLFQLRPLLLVMTLPCPPCSVEVKSCLPKQTFGLPKEKRTHPGSRIWHVLWEGLFYIYNMHFSPLNPHARPEGHV